MVFLEPVGCVDEEIVERGKEHEHDGIRSGEPDILEDGYLHQRLAIRLGLEIVLPETERDKEQDRHADKSAYPWRVPSYDVTFGKRKE